MTYGDARPGEGREERGEEGWRRLNPGLSQNPLNHSFMSASLFNESQKRFLVRKRLCAAGKAMYAGISEKKSGFKCAGKKKKKKVVLMVAAWACCHQALRNRVDRFLCRKIRRSIGHARRCQLQSCPRCFNIRTRQNLGESQYGSKKTKTVSSCTV